MKTLDQIISDHRGKVMDKWASYIQEYEHLFARFRNQAIVLLEIGVQNGGSLELWNEYFHAAKAIIGCDINPECATLRFKTDRIHLVIGDANDDQCANQIATISPGLDIIIDDGSHTAKDIIGVFLRYFPRLKSDGLYVIEDLHCSYWRDYEGGLAYPYSAISFLKVFIDLLNHEHWGISKQRRELVLKYSHRYGLSFDEEVLASIHSITFFNSLCLIRKVTGPTTGLGSRRVVGDEAQVCKELSPVTTPNQGTEPWTRYAFSAEEHLIYRINDLDNRVTDLGRSKRELERQVGELTHALLGATSQVDTQREVLGTRDREFAALKERLWAADAELANARQTLAQSAQALAACETQVGELHATISSLHKSIYWRLTAPLRIARRLARQLYYSRLGHPLALVWRALTTRSRAPLRDWRAARIIARSQQFDKDWYLANNPDVFEGGINPINHYVAFGAREGRDPSPSFSTASYLANNPDVASAGVNPFSHFIRHGANEGRTGSLGRALKLKPLDDINWLRPVVMIIDSVYPRPDRDSGSVDAINFVRIFQDLGYQVVFAPTVDFSAPSPYRDRLESMGVIAVRPPRYPSIEAFLHAAGTNIDVCFLSRADCGGQYTEQVRRRCPHAKVIFNTVDLQHLREEREARLRGDRRALNLAQRTREREIVITRLADATIVVSQYEEELLNKIVPGAAVHTVPLIREAPGHNGNGFAQRRGIGFIGGYSHLPNIDAVHHFLDKIWPSIYAQMPDVQFLVIGANLPADIANRRDSGFVPVGHVEDLTKQLGRMRLTVAPLRFGAGAKGKVASSLAHGVPCVASPIAVEGMGLSDEETIVVADTPESFVEKVVRLYTDEHRWTELSERGFALMSQHHSLAAGRYRLENILSEIGAPLPSKEGAVIAQGQPPLLPAVSSMSADENPRRFR
jgi:glycosyltransferase involved in cell wall biosynthesis/cephalosporin hydroxylase